MIHANIRETKRPHGCRGLPTNLGEPGHGKLKAYQWRTKICFDMPVCLVELARSSPGDTALLQLAQSTTELAAAIHVATKRETSQQAFEEYSSLITAYLTGLLKMQPGLRLRPNHHSALHFVDCLLRYGPAHGWWMYPFERVIGVLQNTNTNEKLGAAMLLKRLSCFFLVLLR